MQALHSKGYNLSVKQIFIIYILLTWHAQQISYSTTSSTIKHRLIHLWCKSKSREKLTGFSLQCIQGAPGHSSCQFGPGIVLKYLSCCVGRPFTALSVITVECNGSKRIDNSRLADCHCIVNICIVYIAVHVLRENFTLLK